MSNAAHKPNVDQPAWVCMYVCVILCNFMITQHLCPDPSFTISLAGRGLANVSGVRVCLPLSLSVCAYMCVCVCVCVCLRAPACERVNVCVCVCVPVCASVYPYVISRIHTGTHAHTKYAFLHTNMLCTQASNYTLWSMMETNTHIYIGLFWTFQIRLSQQKFGLG